MIIAELSARRPNLLFNGYTGGEEDRVGKDTPIIRNLALAISPMIAL